MTTSCHVMQNLLNAADNFYGYPSNTRRRSNVVSMLAVIDGVPMLKLFQADESILSKIFQSVLVLEIIY